MMNWLKIQSACVAPDRDTPYPSNIQNMTQSTASSHMSLAITKDPVSLAVPEYSVPCIVVRVGSL